MFHYNLSSPLKPEHSTQAYKCYCITAHQKSWTHTKATKKTPTTKPTLSLRIYYKTTKLHFEDACVK
jgi:hypothetical protein